MNSPTRTLYIVSSINLLKFSANYEQNGEESRNFPEPNETIRADFGLRPSEKASLEVPPSVASTTSTAAESGLSPKANASPLPGSTTPQVGSRNLPNKDGAMSSAVGTFGVRSSFHEFTITPSS